MAGNSPTSPEPIRVLHVVGAMDRAGTETMIMNLYRSFDREFRLRQVSFPLMQCSQSAVDSVS